MDVRLSIGEFSKMTYLSVKALRHYHDVGLLEPAAVDPATGYRSYAPEQVAEAQAIRRFRDLDMPIDQIRVVLRSADETARSEAIVAHLDAMQRQLERTRQTVASLQGLLQAGAVIGGGLAVEHRQVPATAVVAIAEAVAFADAGDWCAAVFAELHAALEAGGIEPAGPDGALYADEFFEDEAGTVTAFVPVAGPVATSSRVAVIELPAVELAVLVHDGPFDDLDRAYGDLGTYVAARGLSAGGPIRELYLTAVRTEVGWPIHSG